MDKILLYSAAFFTMIWGTAHLFPTKSVVLNFGDISTDNRQIITMEWLIEGIALIFTGCLTGLVTYLDYRNEISQVVFLISAIFLFLLAAISFFTGFRIAFLPYKLCPFIFSFSGILILIGGVFHGAGF
ncbi:MAG: hypothetical protein JSV24_07800 [Bacteroidales bacterium]|nr:MAG: hypothetical protein JSV24_07800 [Bacteroidales bacterium]